jgi:aliphatic aldoxime dehydratase
MSDFPDQNETGPGLAAGRCPVRRFPLRRPEGHRPPVPRYSASLTSKIAVLFLGVQSRDRDTLEAAVATLSDYRRDAEHAPDYHDDATFTDKNGYLNHVAALYWLDARAYRAWSAMQSVAEWRQRTSSEFKVGVWWEPVVVASGRAETITFKEFRRGFSGCPAGLQPTEGSGYWGAARDRVPDSADNLFEARITRIDDGAGGPVVPYRAVRPPENMTVIRSGVSWEKCEGEQLSDYRNKIKPKLDAGMDYLRDHPGETGCLALRQVVAVDGTGQPLQEAYSLGSFLSLAHLESWSQHHPTHLAIYTSALAARKKYQDALQLLTYNEIFVLDEHNPVFEYFNCHPQTGLLPHAHSLGGSSSS